MLPILTFDREKVSKYIDRKRQILLTHNFFFIDVYIEEL